MKAEVQPNKVIVLTGSGVSAESGLPTFRDSNGLWRSFSWQEVASPEGWRARPAAVLDFYNERRQLAWAAKPNAAHEAIAALESKFEVVVVTQNVDELHERAGSSNVVHVHGQLAYARSTSPHQRRYRIDGEPIHLGQLAKTARSFVLTSSGLARKHSSSQRRDCMSLRLQESSSSGRHSACTPQLPW